MEMASFLRYMDPHLLLSEGWLLRRPGMASFLRYMDPHLLLSEGWLLCRPGGKLF